MTRYDAAVIGSGPAGLEAALNLKIRNKRFLLFGTEDLSRKVTTAPRVDNYLGLPGISGKDLQAQFQAHLADMDIAIQAEQVQMVYPMGSYFSIATTKNTYEATAVILACGTFSAKLLDGEQEFLGRGVGYCATCDAPLYRGKTAVILGYTDESVHDANFLAEVAAKVYYVPVKKTRIMPRDDIEIVQGRPTRITGDSVVRQLILADRALTVDGVFILRETVAPASLIPGIRMEGGFIHVDIHMATNLAGCFAAGDCTGRPHQYMRAAGQGQSAALNAVAYMDQLKQ